MKSLICTIVLLFYVGDMNVIAEESVPEQEKIHIVDLPAGAKPECWTKESNKDGMKVVWLWMQRPNTPHRLVLVGKDGSIVEGAQYLNPEVMREIIWLNDSSFACIASGGWARSFYGVYTISRGKGGKYALNIFCSGVVRWRTKFVVKDGFLNAVQDNVILVSVPIPLSKEKMRK